MRLPPRALYRLFPPAARLSNWVEERYSRGGRWMLGMLVAGALFGIDLNRTLAHQLAVLALALLLASHLVSVRWRPRIQVARILPDCVTDQQAFSYWLEIRNDGTEVERDLLVHDRLQQPLLSLAEFRAERAESGGASNWFDRAIGFPRWVAMRRRRRGADLMPVSIPSLPPGSSVRVRIDAHCLRRGWLHFEAVELRRPDPLGLVHARLRRPLAAALLALPQRHPVPRLTVVSGRRYQRGGLSLAFAVGESQEFASLREYRPGDPRRHIHWRSFAKTGELIVKEYQDEYFDRHALVVDTCAGPGDQALFEGVIRCAASIAAGERPRDSILDLLFTGTETLELSAGRGLGDARRVLTWLAEARPADAADFHAVGARLVARAAECASVVLVLGRWDDARREVVRDLALRGTHTVCLVLHDGDGAPPLTDVPGVHWLRLAYLAGDLQRLAVTI